MMNGFIPWIYLSLKTASSASLPRSSKEVLKLMAFAGHSTIQRPQDWQSPLMYAVVSRFVILGTSKGHILTQVRHPTHRLSSTNAPAPQFMHRCASFTAAFKENPSSTSSKLSSLLSEDIVGISCFCSFLIKAILGAAISGTAGYSAHFSSFNVAFLRALWIAIAAFLPCAMLSVMVPRPSTTSPPA